jgi:hypothetical protein
MRSTGTFVKLCICIALIAAATASQAMEVNINFLLSRKGLDSDDWGESALGVEADSQGAFGVATSFGKPAWPVAIALDYYGSAHYDDVLVNAPPLAEVDLTQMTWEFDFGVRKIWKAGKARPFVGGGFALLGARQEVPVPGTLLTVDDDDATPGLWINGGSFWRLGKKFNIGVDLRFSAGEVKLFGRDVEAGGAMLGLILGWGWGGGGS